MGASDKSDRTGHEQSPQAVSAVPVTIPSAMWVHYDWDRPVDLSERGAGFIEGFASACASLSYVLCHYPDGGKSYDPMKVNLPRGTMHSYVFNMRDGGRSHPLADYSTYQDIANVLFMETIEAIADEPGICSAVIARLAQAIEARSDETAGLGPQGESAVGSADAPEVT